MNKLIIAITAIAVSVVAQAASVDWSLNSVSNSPDANKATGWVAYLVSADNYATFLTKTGSDVATYVAANALYSGTTKSGGKGAINVAESSGSYSVGQKENAFLVIFNNAKASDATYYAYTSTKESGAVGDAGANISLAYGTFSGNTSGWQAVPEPTSAMLMLLGMAGLALRRRCA